MSIENMTPKEWEKEKKRVDKEVYYKEIMSPMNVINIGRNTVLFFYKDVDSVLAQMIALQKEQDEIGELELPFHFGYEVPSKANYMFKGRVYPCISLWYDNEQWDAEQVTRQFN